MYSSGRRRTIIILFVTSLLLITLDLRGNAAFNAGRTVFGYILRPFEIAGSVIAQPIDRWWASFTEVDALRAENDRLRARIDSNSGDMIAAENAIIQANELKDLFYLDSLGDYDRVTTGIIGDSPSNFDQRVEIDVGSQDGIKTGMPVINGAGLVGKVHRVFPETSIVMLTTDPEYSVRVKVVGSASTAETTVPPPTAPSGIPLDSIQDVADSLATTAPPTTNPVDPFPPGTIAGSSVPPTATTSPVAPASSVPPSSVPGTATTVAETTTTSSTLPPVRETGQLVGRGGAALPVVEFVDEAKQFGRIKVGDAVLTTGGRLSLAPADLPVGRVKSISATGGVEGLSIEVELSADLNRLNFLTVVLYQPSTELNTG